ncbi:MAG TPA: TetR/AcrR family transcriptional regulator [Elusimicrobiota bacterium]|nr:TetR/AcrR family transcriptional regulator [Elusimicrobiota bacterium]
MTIQRIDNPEIRKKQILLAAEAALGEKGFHNILLDDVARYANVSKGTLYLYFQDKDDLFDALFQSIASDINARMASLPDLGTLSPIQQLRRITEEQLVFFREHKEFFSQISLTKPEIYGKRTGGALRLHFAKYVRFLAEKIRAAVQSGELREHDPNLGALMLMALFRMFFLEASLLEPGVSAPLTLETAWDFFLRGVGREKRP